MIKQDEDYRCVESLKSAEVTMFTETEFVMGKRPGVMALEYGRIVFREEIRNRGKRSRPMTRTQHISVRERPDGSISGTFHFRPNEKRIADKMCEEFGQALGVTLIAVKCVG